LSGLASRHRSFPRVACQDWPLRTLTLKGSQVGNKLYVGNLAYSVRDENLQERFAEFGTVTSAKVMMDRETGRSKGFGFFEMSSPVEAHASIRGLNGQSLDGRAIVVNEARPKEAGSGGFGGDNRRPSGGGGGGGGYGGRRSY